MSHLATRVAFEIFGMLLATDCEDLGCGTREHSGLEMEVSCFESPFIVEDACSRYQFEVLDEACESQWCSERLLPLKRKAAPGESGENDLAFLMPGYSLWKWENFDLPELCCSEVEACITWHNFNATRTQFTNVGHWECCVCVNDENIPSTPIAQTARKPRSKPSARAWHRSSDPKASLRARLRARLRAQLGAPVTLLAQAPRVLFSPHCTRH